MTTATAVYPGNCGGNLIKDLLRYFKPFSVLDPMTGSGTCRDVCEEMGIYCYSSDLHQGADACDASQFPPACFDFCLGPPALLADELYTEDPRCLSRRHTLPAFLERYRLLIDNCAGSLDTGWQAGHPHGRLPATARPGTFRWCSTRSCLPCEAGLRQHCTDIIRFSHGNSSSKKVYRAASFRACMMCA